MQVRAIQDDEDLDDRLLAEIAAQSHPDPIRIRLSSTIFKPGSPQRGAGLPGRYITWRRVGWTVRVANADEARALRDGLGQIFRALDTYGMASVVGLLSTLDSTGRPEEESPARTEGLG